METTDAAEVYRYLSLQYLSRETMSFKNKGPGDCQTGKQL